MENYFTKDELSDLIVFFRTVTEDGFRLVNNEVHRVCPVCRQLTKCEDWSFRNHVKECSPLIFNEITRVFVVFFGTLKQIQLSGMTKIESLVHVIDPFRAEDIINRIKTYEKKNKQRETRNIWFDNTKYYRTTSVDSGTHRYEYQEYLKRKEFKLGSDAEDDKGDLNRYYRDVSLDRYMKNLSLVKEIFNDEGFVTDRKIREYQRTNRELNSGLEKWCVEKTKDLDGDIEMIREDIESLKKKD